MKIREGQAVRYGYGYAWTDFNTLTFTMFPIPFNYLARWIRKLFVLVMQPPIKDLDMASLLSRAREEGYRKGAENKEKEMMDNLRRNLMGR